MINNYLKIAIRHLRKNKVYTLLNIFGLAIGLSCCILILMYLQTELSFDDFHTNKNRVYRLVRKCNQNDKIQYKTGFPAPMAEALMNDFPEIESITRFGWGWGLSPIISYGEKQFRNNNHSIVDNDIFNTFTITILQGNPETALENPSGIVISEELSSKLFGNIDPIGKIVSIGDNYPIDFIVTGVMKNYPQNSHLQMDYLTSFDWYYKKNSKSGNLRWKAWNYQTYILLNKKYSPNELKAKFPQFIKKYFGQNENDLLEIELQPLTDVHVNLSPINSLPTNINASRIYLFMGIGILLLVMACFNFINLSIAIATKREKEIGVRKVNGASKSEIMFQFLSESVMITVFAMLFAIPLTEMLLPIFNNLNGKYLTFQFLHNWSFWVTVLLFGLSIGIIAGLYPALFVSGFKPHSILKGISKRCSSKSSIRLKSVFIIFQFIVTILFLIFTFIVYNQVNYLSHKNLGYDKEHLIIVPVSHKTVRPKYNLYKTEILRNTNIKGASATSYIPSFGGYCQNTWWEGMPKTNKNGDMISWIPIDENFLETLSISLVKGRNFSLEFNDKQSAYILNESAVKYIGWGNPLGKWYKINYQGPVIGVVKDFHFKSLHQELQPMAFCFDPQLFEYLIIKISPASIHNTLTFLEQKWKEFFPTRPFEFSFYDEEFDKMYKSELNARGVFIFVALLSILISGLGLLGLVSFSIEEKIKEIGVRKVLGASIPNILTMLTRDFTKWIIIANFIAWPIAWYFMNKWLDNFAYHIEMTILPFLLAGLSALMIALFTMSIQALKAALSNPVESLRYE